PRVIGLAAACVGLLNNAVDVGHVRFDYRLCALSFGAKQAGAAWAIVFTVEVALFLFSAVLILLPFLACLTVPIALIVPIGIGGYGTYMAYEGQIERIPVVGELVEDLLKGVQAPKQLGA
ncbi:MAG: hypothetical protein AAFX99_17295, partial [Myxococcota bacterium]